MSKLYKSKTLEKYTLSAADGYIGKIKDFYFDDYSWIIRYLSVNSVSWLERSEVLISPIAIGKIQEEEQVIEIEITQKEIKSIPPVEKQRPVSRHYEKQYFQHFNWPPYWKRYHDVFPSVGEEFYENAFSLQWDENEPTSLRSAVEVEGYAIRTKNEEIGHVHEFVVDQRYWIIRYLVIDTTNVLSHKKLLISPSWIRQVSCLDKEISIDLKINELRTAPEFVSDLPITRSYEELLFRHYGFRAYWENPVSRMGNQPANLSYSNLRC